MAITIERGKVIVAFDSEEGQWDVWCSPYDFFEHHVWSLRYEGALQLANEKSEGKMVVVSDDFQTQYRLWQLKLRETNPADTADTIE